MAAVEPGSPAGEKVTDVPATRLDMDVGHFRGVWPSDIVSVVTVGPSAVVRYRLAGAAPRLELVRFLPRSNSPLSLSGSPDPDGKKVMPLQDAVLAVYPPPNTSDRPPLSPRGSNPGSRQASPPPQPRGQQAPQLPALSSLHHFSLRRRSMLLCIAQDRRSFVVVSVAGCDNRDANADENSADDDGSGSGGGPPGLDELTTGSFPTAARHVSVFCHRGGAPPPCHNSHPRGFLGPVFFTSPCPRDALGFR